MKTTIAFSDMTIDGELVKPEGAFVGVRKDIKFKNFIKDHVLTFVISLQNRRTISRDGYDLLRHLGTDGRCRKVNITQSSA